MSNLTKRSTVYFEPSTHQALKIRAASSETSMSELINDAVRLLMYEDQEDLAAISERSDELVVIYEDFINRLRVDGKIK
ncbi:hypothetical protein GCM10008107_19710 [Psychrosphaera saromensis]|uniref:CopG family transcriptional regulator n=1 Tax=Psychrosphaera saromensis TaxID=716813 RepID=A0A2S7UT26_9GAMM|nr:CopG family transcriptional regulator [Psychrosphaera saromensis]PQJ52672.1 CopG family transcriptional regulator [Psychrosphaera saromensis]GHB70389.1 hypothetical protein GCM10008107_19710 [Psychrosphaera saromensis]GLQ13156.1 hypothetical protein GCM10007917_06110 [Psychrosphaera saromensis]